MAGVVQDHKVPDNGGADGKGGPEVLVANQTPHRENPKGSRESYNLVGSSVLYLLVWGAQKPMGETL